MRILNKLLLIFLLFNNYLFSQSFTENDWQTAFNDLVLRGKEESVTALGRVDILTEEYAVEIDYARNYREGIRQALQYAGETGRRPGIALIIDGKGDSFYNLIQAKIICNKEKIKFWLINEYVGVSDLIARKNIVSPNIPFFNNSDLNNILDEKVEAKASNSESRKISAPSKLECEYWLNTKSNVRHNKNCRWFMNTKSGRCCNSDDGRPCGQCGG